LFYYYDAKGSYRLQEAVMNTGRYSSKYQSLPRVHISRMLVFGMLIVTALLAFEIFNFSTTEFALKDLLGGLRFAGVTWATILAIAFCGIDFAGLARMFTPEVGTNEPREVWYLFGAWMLAAMMNALLTWWGVSIAISHHQTLGNGIVARQTLIQVVPVFVAIMVWMIRVLIIGTFSATGDRLFGNREKTHRYTQSVRTPAWEPIARPKTARSLTYQPGNYGRTSAFQPAQNHARPVMSQRPGQTPLSAIYRPAPRTTQNNPPEPDSDLEYEANYLQADPEYVPVGMEGQSQDSKTQARF
jgi:hypothetical protein